MFNISGRIKITQETRRIQNLLSQLNLSDALDAACRVRDLSAQIYGLNHVNYVLSINNLAGVLFKLGNYQDAEPLLSQAIAIMRNTKKSISPFHADLYSACLNGLAETKRMLGAYEESITIHEEALAVREPFEFNHPEEVAQSLQHLAEAHIEAGHTDKARTLLERALNLRTRSLGENHPDTIRTRDTLAII